MSAHLLDIRSALDPTLPLVSLQAENTLSWTLESQQMTPSCLPFTYHRLTERFHLDSSSAMSPALDPTLQPGAPTSPHKGPSLCTGVQKQV